jgi:hypothetical protein
MPSNGSQRRDETMDATQDFPISTSIGGRHFFARHEVEAYKCRLMGLTPTERDPATPVVFVTAQQLSDELQINRRTLGRRIRGRIRGEVACWRSAGPEGQVTIAEPEWIRVGERSFEPHYRPDKPASVLTKFRCGLVVHKAWYCPSHTETERKKAWEFWLSHGGSAPCPADADEWIARAVELHDTAEICVRPEGKYISVVGARPVLLSEVAL